MQNSPNFTFAFFPSPRSDDHQLRGPFGELEELRWRHRWLCAPRVGQRHVTRRGGTISPRPLGISRKSMSLKWGVIKLGFVTQKKYWVLKTKKNESIRTHVQFAKQTLGYCQEKGLSKRSKRVVFPTVGDCSRVFVKKQSVYLLNQTSGLNSFTR